MVGPVGSPCTLHSGPFESVDESLEVSSAAAVLCSRNLWAELGRNYCLKRFFFSFIYSFALGERVKDGGSV